MNFANKQVLIIEDQRPFLLLLRGLLNAMGASKVVTKATAEQSISECKKNKFDVILCDLHLGVNKKNGFELIEELRARKLIKPTCIFIIISADSARPVVLGSLERSPDDYLIKPFSHVQLKTRIVRAWQKRKFLTPVFRAVADDDLPKAKKACEKLLDAPSHYRGSCEKLLVEIYWQLNEPKPALGLLSKYGDGRPIMWAQIALAKTHLLMKQPQQAIKIIDGVLAKHRFSADAHDILAQAHDMLQEGTLALNAIKTSIKLSPFSLERHFIACTIAQNNNDYVLASESSKAIWDLSKRSVHHNTMHWCGYIRSLLDVAEHTDEKSVKNRYQQEALLELQRARFDEYLQRLSSNFSIDIYNDIVQARLNAIDGKMLDAKKSIVRSQVAIEEKFGEIPPIFLPDSLKVMYDIGEFEDAQELNQIVEKIPNTLDPNGLYLIKKEGMSAKEKLTQYQQFNKQGIELYQEGQFEKARDAFGLAQQFAPVNTGVALNLLQCLLRILDKGKKPEPKLVTECRRIHKLIDDMPLKRQHQEKYDALHNELMTYIGKK